MIVPRTLVVIALSLATLAIASPYANDAEGMVSITFVFRCTSKLI